MHLINRKSLNRSFYFNKGPSTEYKVENTEKISIPNINLEIETSIDFFNQNKSKFNDIE